MRGIDPLLPGGWWHDMSGKLARPLYTPFCRVRKEKYRCGTEIRPANEKADVQSPARRLYTILLPRKEGNQKLAGTTCKPGKK